MYIKKDHKLMTFTRLFSFVIFIIELWYPTLKRPEETSIKQLVIKWKWYTTLKRPVKYLISAVFWEAYKIFY